MEIYASIIQICVYNVTVEEGHDIRAVLWFLQLRHRFSLFRYLWDKHLTFDINLKSVFLIKRSTFYKKNFILALSFV